MLTEEEAKTKWCPHVRLTAGNDPSGIGAQWHTNRPSVADVDQKGFDLCAAPGCMAWRWGVHYVVVKHKPTGGTKAIKAKAAKLICGPDAEFEIVDHIPRKGYCGAFGKPEGV